MTQHLFIFQIGPVQAFIAQARRTADLYTGSRILSMIARAGVEKAQEAHVTMLFPVEDKDRELPESIPHRFAFTSDTPSPEVLGNEIEEALRNAWRQNFAAKVHNWLKDTLKTDTKWGAKFDSQTRDWLEIYWVAISMEDNATYGDVYKDAGRLMAARKAARHFPQIDDEAATKCTMTGAAAALDVNWKELRDELQSQHGEKFARSVLRSNEQLGAIAIVKRFATRAECNLGIRRDALGFRSTTRIAGNEEDQEYFENTLDLEYPYLAILLMDGDKMGKRLGMLKEASGHSEMSAKLSAFGKKVTEIIQEPAELVYTGGDDVLAFLPLNTALSTANAIYDAFISIVEAETIDGERVSISAGIAIMGVNTPLDSALEEAKTAEKRAKKIYGRNALVVRDIRSSSIREVGAKWDSYGNFCGEIEKLQNWIKEGKISGKLGYEMLEIAHNMFGPELKDARRAELGRLIKRRTDSGKKLTETEAGALLDFLTTFAEQRSWTDAANWVILARFLAKGGKRA